MTATLLTPEKIYERFQDLVMLRGRKRHHTEFTEEAMLGRFLANFYESHPIGIGALNALVHAYDFLQLNQQDSFAQNELVHALEKVNDATATKTFCQAGGLPFSLAPPGYTFLSSPKPHSFLFNINEAIGQDKKTRTTIIGGYAQALRELRAKKHFDKLCFFHKRFGPVGAIELQTTLIDKLKLPAVTYAPYVWHQGDLPIESGKVKAGDRLCAVYDATVSGREITDLDDYMREKQANVVAAAVYFDFQEGARVRLLNQGIALNPVVQKHEVLEGIVKAYRTQYHTAFVEHPSWNSQ